MLFPTLEQRIAMQSPPDQMPIMKQNWRELLFLHWKYPSSVLQSLVPKGLFIDTFQDEAYIGIVPFLMRDVKPIFFGSLGGSNFCELNLRTYVYDENGIPGVWFFSLDANHWLSVQMATIFFHLPYHYSTMSAQKSNDFIDYFCSRGEGETTVFSYKQTKTLGKAVPETLEFFLIERYLLYAANSSGKIYKGRIHHKPYELSEVVVKTWDESVLTWNGIAKTGRAPDHLIFSKGVDVQAYPIQAANRA